MRRAARTPHYDGVKKGEKEPVVIGIFGEAPIFVQGAVPDGMPKQRRRGAVPARGFFCQSAPGRL